MDEKLLHFGDIELGHSWVSARRTVTEADIVAFAGLSGDFNPLHVDEEFAKKTIFGRRIAHGVLGLSICTGLPTSEPSWHVMAFMGVDWRFKKPIFIGDTIHMRATVIETKPMHRLGGGMVTFKVEILNQRDEVVQRGTWGLLVKNREV